MSKSKIEWTESTWNPVTGCTKISTGCKNCYAERMAKRLQAMGQKNYRNGFKLTCHPESLDLPLRWKKPQIIFVNSMSDLFHEDVPLDFIQGGSAGPDLKLKVTEYPSGLGIRPLKQKICHRVT